VSRLKKFVSRKRRTALRRAIFVVPVGAHCLDSPRFRSAPEFRIETHKTILSKQAILFAVALPGTAHALDLLKDAVSTTHVRYVVGRIIMNRKSEGYEKRNGTPQDQNIMAEISMVILCVLTPNGFVVGINISEEHSAAIFSV
jgi:hypothetical protein